MLKMKTVFNFGAGGGRFSGPIAFGVSVRRRCFPKARYAKPKITLRWCWILWPVTNVEKNTFYSDGLLSLLLHATRLR
jgi:hypothetical protein